MQVKRSYLAALRIIDGTPVNTERKACEDVTYFETGGLFNMRYITFLATFLFLFTACNSNQPSQQTTAIDPAADAVPIAEGDYWAKDNFDLQRVGAFLEESDDPQEFEAYLNDDDGINNLDLNGDGYVDYISVDEFEDRDSNSRGLSLFSRFGPDLIQEIATIFFYRDDLNYPGARILLAGNEQLYGDNYYYETNWLDRTMPIATFLFSDRDQYYHSPYYYDNYPPNYVAYEVVDTPIYVSRIERLYPQPAFVYTTAPEYISKIKIKSPHNGKWLDKIHARLAKPTKEQAQFIKNTPFRGQLAKDRGSKPGRDDPPRSDRGDERGNPARDDRGAERGNPDRPAGKTDRPDVKPGKADAPGQDKSKGQGQAQGQGQGKGQGQGQGQGQGKGKGGGQGKGGGKGKP